MSVQNGDEGINLTKLVIFRLWRVAATWLPASPWELCMRIVQALCRRLAAIALQAVVAVLPAAAQEVMIVHAEGETTLPATPETVIVTDWAAFDNLAALGIPVAGVPTGNVPPYLADKVGADPGRVGSLQEPDVEQIAAAAPDLVVVASRSRPAYPTLSGIAPTIDMTVDNADLVGGVKAKLATYGQRVSSRPELTVFTGVGSSVSTGIGSPLSMLTRRPGSDCKGGWVLATADLSNFAFVTTLVQRRAVWP